jgi:chloramphenicol O-acetyltransferase type B
MFFNFNKFTTSVKKDTPISLLDEFNSIKSIKKEEQTKYITDFIEVGDFSYGIPQVFYYNKGLKLKIGKFCSIASGVSIMIGGEHPPDWITTYPFSAFFNNQVHKYTSPSTAERKNKDVVIENDVWLGKDCTIMSGVKVSNGAIIGNKALVTKDVPPYAIVGGVPAKIIKMRFEKHIVDSLLQIKWWDWEDEKILNAIHILESNNIEQLISYYNNFMNTN